MQHTAATATLVKLASRRLIQLADFLLPFTAAN
jgi:hypothetical protein